MIIPISRANIDLLEKCAPGLQRELDRSDLDECWDIQALYDHVVNFQAYALLQEESGLAGVFCINETPFMRILNLFWLGKDPDNKTPCDYKELDQFLVHAGEHFGCARVVCDGRKGWARVVEPLGYRDSGRVYVKSIGA